MYRPAFRQPRVASLAGAEHLLMQRRCIRPWIALPLPSTGTPDKQTSRREHLRRGRYYRMLESNGGRRLDGRIWKA